jgi:hypothetical protein
MVPQASRIIFNTFICEKLRPECLLWLGIRTQRPIFKTQNKKLECRPQRGVTDLLE